MLGADIHIEAGVQTPGVSVHQQALNKPTREVPLRAHSHLGSSQTLHTTKALASQIAWFFSMGLVNTTLRTKYIRIIAFYYT